jgi:hypothetical protein
LILRFSPGAAIADILLPKRAAHCAAQVLLTVWSELRYHGSKSSQEKGHVAMPVDPANAAFTGKAPKRTTGKSR